ncbi:MAG: hypothetical protein MMC33_001398 [Icmadophila ericetorum]|nr:hypothetical protein [Icmadophila ericetorum]
MDPSHVEPSRVKEVLGLQDASGDLESHLRGMILRNAANPVLKSSQRHQVGRGTVQDARSNIFHAKSQVISTPPQISTPSQIPTPSKISTPPRHQQLHEVRQHCPTSNMVHSSKRKAKYGSNIPAVNQVSANVNIQPPAPSLPALPGPPSAPTVSHPTFDASFQAYPRQVPTVQLPVPSASHSSTQQQPKKPQPLAASSVNTGKANGAKANTSHNSQKTIINRAPEHQTDSKNLSQAAHILTAPTLTTPTLTTPTLTSEPQHRKWKPSASSSDSSGGISLGSVLPVPSPNPGNGRLSPNGSTYPHKSGPTGRNGNNSNEWRLFAAVNLQNHYLEEVAIREISKAEADKSETSEKEHFRNDLEAICQTVIGKMEQAKNPEFNHNSVVLVCFGSLASGFATKSSDMDLALQSPYSVPELTSNESVIPRLLEKALMDKGYGVRLLTRARVPIIKLCEKPSPELAEALRQERIKWESAPTAEPKNESAKSAPAEKKKKRRQKGKETGDLHENVDRKNGIQGVGKREMEKGQDKDSGGELLSDDEGAASGKRVMIMHIQNDNQTPTKTGAGERQSEQPAKPFPFEEHSDETLVEMVEIAVVEGWFNNEERNIIKRFFQALKQIPRDPDKLNAAREELKQLSGVLKRYRPKRERDTSLDFPKQGVGIQCDINFANPLAIHNTQLLRCYALCNPLIRKMVIFVKAWAKVRKINSPYHGTLSSYGFVLMVLHYAVNIACPPLAPNLQLLPGAQRQTVGGYDVTFWRNEKEIVEQIQSNNHCGNRASLGDHLRLFFTYFAWQSKAKQGGYTYATDVVSLRTPGGILSKRDKGWTEMTTTKSAPVMPNEEAKEIKNRHLFCIEDPFEHEHNVARTVDYDGINRIRDEFKRACDHIRFLGEWQKGKFTNMFEEAEEPTRPYRFFGPRPRAQANNLPVYGPQNLPKNQRPRFPYWPPKYPPMHGPPKPKAESSQPPKEEMASLVQWNAMREIERKRAMAQGSSSSEAPKKGGPSNYRF